MTTNDAQKSERMPGPVQDLQQLLYSTDEGQKKDKVVMHVLKKLDSGAPLSQPLPLKLAVKMLYRRWQIEQLITPEMELQAKAMVHEGQDDW